MAKAKKAPEYPESVEWFCVRCGNERSWKVKSTRSDKGTIFLALECSGCKERIELVHSVETESQEVTDAKVNRRTEGYEGIGAEGSEA